MDAWGLDQLAAEEWMGKNFEDHGDALIRRDAPLTDAEFCQRHVRVRKDMESKLSGYLFPATFEAYRVRA